MATVSGIWNHPATVVSPTVSESSKTSASSDTSVSNGDASGISSNDFLTLLVTEMQNQDPTANTDPNEWINQLVQVNSLEQLININQTLSNNSGAGKGTTGHTTGGQLPSSGPIQAVVTGGIPSANPSNPATPSGSAAGTTKAFHATVSGNLSIPAANPAAARVAAALGGKTHSL